MIVMIIEGDLVVGEEVNYWERVLARRMSRRSALKAGAGAGLGLAAFSLVGCPQPQQRIEVATKEPKYGGVYRYPLSEEPIFLDPHSNGSLAAAQIFGMVYNRLVRYVWAPGIYQGDETIVPDLAERWEQPDETTYIFYLRKDVKFHDIPPVNGRELGADDVKYSFLRLQDRKVNVQGAGNFGYIKSVQAVDKYTLKFTTAEPFVPFITSLAQSYLPWIVPREAVEKFGDLKKNVIGTGPFILDSYERNSKMTFTKNPDYFVKDQPFLDGVTLRFGMDQSALESAFAAGEVDVRSAGLGEVEELMTAVPDAVLHKGRPTTYSCISMNISKTPFNNVKVRQAIKLAIDYQKIIDTLYGGDAFYGGLIASVYDRWVLPQVELRMLYQTDVDRARQLIVEAGYPDGFRTTLYTSPAFGQNYVDLAELIAGDLRQIGIQAETRSVDYARYVTDQTGLAYEMLVGPARTGTDPDDFTYAGLHPKGSRNFSGFNDPKMNLLLEKQRKQFNYTERKQTVDEIQRYFAQIVPEIPVPQGYTYDLARGYLKEFGLTHEAARAGLTLGLWLDK